MENLYFFQVNYSYGNTYHLPYTAAALSAYAFTKPSVAEKYRLKDIFFIRSDTEELMDKIENPAVAAFSTYIWNFEFNKLMASKLKEKYPDIKIIFGGHNVNPGGKLLRECPYIDYLIHGEGEEAFAGIMQFLSGEGNLRDINGISYRKDGEIITNSDFICPPGEYIDYPSPYLEGYFDKILDDHKGAVFMALIETTRGCPYSCAYCDWSNMKSKIRKFPMERIKAEIKWISDHRIPGLGAADSNFGIFERDEEIIDYIVETSLTTGVPQGFQTSYAKNSNERIFRIGRKLDRYRINKGVTLSFQSMSDKVLEIIGRKNISVDSYKELMKMYNDAGVATYTELILGLPGETYGSFADGIDTLLNLGQHNSLYIHNCECLMCSVLGSPGYMEKYKIGVSRLLLNQPHIEQTKQEVNEYSRLITSTFSMTHEDWIKMNLFSFTVQSFHYFSLTQFIAVFLHSETGMSYRKFYESIFSASQDEEGFPLLYKLYSFIKCRLEDIINEKEGAAFTCTDRRFGRVQWSFEEYLFLGAVYESEELFGELDKIFSGCGLPEDLFEELMYFQQQMIIMPFEVSKKIKFGYDFCSYFRSYFKEGKTELKKVKNTIKLNVKSYDSWSLYAKNIVWFGRKDGKSTYLFDCTVDYPENAEGK